MESTITCGIEHVSTEPMGAGNPASLVIVKTTDGREIVGSLSVLETAELAADLISNLHPGDDSDPLSALTDRAERRELARAFEIIGLALAGHR